MSINNSIDLVKVCLELLDRCNPNFSPETYLRNIDQFEVNFLNSYLYFILAEIFTAIQNT